MVYKTDSSIFIKLSQRFVTNCEIIRAKYCCWGIFNCILYKIKSYFYCIPVDLFIRLPSFGFHSPGRKSKLSRNVDEVNVKKYELELNLLFSGNFYRL